MKTRGVTQRKTTQVLTLQKPHRYEKPLFEEQTELTFPRELLEAFNAGRMCIQCSSCHGCR
jgi:hypothetical protein